MGLYTPFSLPLTSTGTGSYGITGNNTYTYYPNVIDGFYEDDGRLFWKNSKGEVYQVTFTKQETVNKIINDL